MTQLISSFTHFFHYFFFKATRRWYTVVKLYAVAKEIDEAMINKKTVPYQKISSSLPYWCRDPVNK